MAVLSDADRAVLTAAENRRLSDAREAITLTRAQLRAAYNAIDQFLEDNATAINNAFPAAAKGALTAKQKARILMQVAQKRMEAL